VSALGISYSGQFKARGLHGRLTLNNTSILTRAVSEMENRKQVGTYHEAPIIQLRVSKERHGGCSWDVPNEVV